MVVSFMIAVPLPWRRPLAGDLTPATNTTAPIRHPLPDFFEELFRTTRSRRDTRMNLAAPPGGR